MRSIVCAAAFLLLDRLQASASTRKLSALAAGFTGSSRYSELFQRIIHTSWLGPGLVVAALLVVLALTTDLSHKPQKTKILKRKFSAPRLEKYQGAFRKRHQDLEV